MSILANLQKAASLEDLAKILGYKPSTLSYIIYKIPPAKRYKEFEIQKNSGGARKICAPIEPLKTLQRHLANVLYVCREQIDAEHNRRSLSHGFRRQHSIITNARNHKRRRYVLNLDLQDFFPTLNFGRVRGFFLKNHHFDLNEKVATIVAQISCHQNSLPQGSPCSPIIADLVAHLLDVRLAQLAKQCRATYSRYADDLTFSTNQKEFPNSLAVQDKSDRNGWILGDDLVRIIERSGFAINHTKTRMQCRTSRQLVTGLTVNEKVNIRPEYYRHARAICHSLFKTGKYFRPSLKNSAENNPQEPELISALGPIEGILSHIHHVKDSIDSREKTEKRKSPTAARNLYIKFLTYRYFVAQNRPLIICEGITDSVYLKFAIRKLTDFHPKLGEFSDEKFVTSVSFFNYTNQAHNLLGLNGGSGDFKFFFLSFKKRFQAFGEHEPKHPVIVLLDNDDGAKDIFKVIQEVFKVSVNYKTRESFYHLTGNLYLIKTPEHGNSGKSCIEDLFSRRILATKIDGKKFNPTKSHDANGEYGKVVFAEKVVRAKSDTVDFSKFGPLLNRIVAAIDHYEKPDAH